MTVDEPVRRVAQARQGADREHERLREQEPAGHGVPAAGRDQDHGAHDGGDRRAEARPARVDVRRNVSARTDGPGIYGHVLLPDAGEMLMCSACPVGSTAPCRQSQAPRAYTSRSSPGRNRRHGAWSAAHTWPTWKSQTTCNPNAPPLPPL